MQSVYKVITLPSVMIDLHRCFRTMYLVERMFFVKFIDVMIYIAAARLLYHMTVLLLACKIM